MRRKKAPYGVCCCLLRYQAPIGWDTECTQCEELHPFFDTAIDSQARQVSRVRDEIGDALVERTIELHKVGSCQTLPLIAIVYWFLRLSVSKVVFYSLTLDIYFNNHVVIRFKMPISLPPIVRVTNSGL